MLHGMESMHQQPIIPGLPDDLGLRCLAMLSHGYHGVMEAVSKRWRDVMRSEEYANYKARLGWCGDWLFVLAGMQKWIAYDPEADRWHPLPPIPDSLGLELSPGICGLGILGCHCECNKLLVMGRTYCILRKHPYRPVYKTLQFDPFKKEWSALTRMRTSRAGLASCAIDGKVYVAGGYNSDYREGTNLAEVYDPLEDKWEDLPPMPVPVSSCTGIAYKGKFHVIEPYVDYPDGPPHWIRGSLIQVFDPLSRSWHVKHEIPSPRLKNVAVDDDQVYLMNDSGTLERRDAEKDEWDIVGEVPPLYHPDDSDEEEHARLYKLGSLGHELYVMRLENCYRRTKDPPEAEDKVDLGRARVCDPRCLPLIWRETRPMCDPNEPHVYIGGWASLKQQ